jgi:hypothetical protein
MFTELPDRNCILLRSIKTQISTSVNIFSVMCIIQFQIILRPVIRNLKFYVERSPEFASSSTLYVNLPGAPALNLLVACRLFQYKNTENLRMITNLQKLLRTTAQKAHDFYSYVNLHAQAGLTTGLCWSHTSTHSGHHDCGATFSKHHRSDGRVKQWWLIKKF